jgi:hypothetical protein
MTMKLERILRHYKVKEWIRTGLGQCPVDDNCVRNNKLPGSEKRQKIHGGDERLSSSQRGLYLMLLNRWF